VAGIRLQEQTACIRKIRLWACDRRQQAAHQVIDIRL